MNDETPTPDPTVGPRPVQIPQRLEAITYRVDDPLGTNLIRIEAWTQGADPQFYFLTPFQALQWSVALARRARQAAAWNGPMPPDTM